MIRNGNVDAESDSIASRRCIEVGQRSEFLLYHMVDAMKDPYNKITNPKGMVNMGTSVNALCSDLVVQRLNKKDIFHFDESMQFYDSYWGTPNLCNAMANFLTENFRASHPVNPNHLIVCNGVTGCLDACAFSMADEGDVFITPTPAYTRIFNDCNERASVEVVALPLMEKESFQPSGQMLENCIQKQLSLGKNVKGFVLTNPSNPLGDLYSPETLMELMNVCKRHNMHFICDEIYALSVFGDPTEFHSILSFPQVPDPMRTHVLYGLSKDFGMASLRVAVIHTQNPDVLAALKLLTFYELVPLCVQEMTAKILNDSEWINNIYLPTYHKRLNESLAVAKEGLESMGVPVRQGKAGIFLMADFRRYVHPLDKNGELELFKKFYQNNVFVVPTTELMMAEAGWFRIIFSNDKEQVAEGLHRIKQVLQCSKIN